VAGWPVSCAGLVVTQRLLSGDLGAVLGLLKGQVQADAFIAAHRTPAEAVVEQELAASLGSGLPPGVLGASFGQLAFTADPLAGAMATEARHAAAAGLTRPAGSLKGLFDLGPLDRVLRAAGQRPVTS